MHSPTHAKSKKTKKGEAATKSRSGAQVAGALQVWEDDPGTGVETTVDPRPDPSATPCHTVFRILPSRQRHLHVAFRLLDRCRRARRGADFGLLRCRPGSGRRTSEPFCPSYSTMTTTKTTNSTLFTIGGR